MKYIIDIIEDIRESIDNQEDFLFQAMLLKESPDNDEKLIYAGESPLNYFDIDREKKRLFLGIDGSDSRVTIGDIVPQLLILDVSDMMYEIRIDINIQNRDIEVVGFGKDEQEKRYILFIKV